MPASERPTLARIGQVVRRLFDAVGVEPPEDLTPGTLEASVHRLRRQARRRMRARSKGAAARAEALGDALLRCAEALRELMLAEEFPDLLDALAKYETHFGGLEHLRAELDAALDRADMGLRRRADELETVEGLDAGTSAARDEFVSRLRNATGDFRRKLDELSFLPRDFRALLVRAHGSPVFSKVSLRSGPLFPQLATAMRAGGLEIPEIAAILYGKTSGREWVSRTNRVRRHLKASPDRLQVRLRISNPLRASEFAANLQRAGLAPEVVKPARRGRPGRRSTPP